MNESSGERYNIFFLILILNLYVVPGFNPFTLYEFEVVVLIFTYLFFDVSYLYTSYGHSLSPASPWLCEALTFITPLSYISSVGKTSDNSFTTWSV